MGAKLLNRVTWGLCLQDWRLFEGLCCLTVVPHRAPIEFWAWSAENSLQKTGVSSAWPGLEKMTVKKRCVNVNSHKRRDVYP